MERAGVRRWVAWWFLAWCFLYLAAASGRISHGDDETRFQVTQNLVEQGALHVAYQMVEMPAMPLEGLLPREGYAFATTMPLASPRDGTLYSRYSPGQSFLAVPLYVLGRVLASLAWPEARAYLSRLTVALWNPLWSAAAVACISAFLARLGYRRTTALLGGAAYGLGSVGAVYSKTFFSEVAVGVCLLAGVWSLWEARQGGNPARVLWGGALAGLAVLLRSTTAVLHVPWLTLFALWPPAEKRPLQWLARALPAWAVPVAVASGLHLAYNVACWTGRYPLGYPDVRWNVPFSLGLWGQLFSPGKSVLLYTPWLVAAALGLALAWRRHRGLVALTGALWVSYVAFHAPYEYWTGGWNWGARFLVPLLPLSTLGLAALWESPNVRGARPLVLLLLGVGIVVQVPAVLVSHSRYLVDLSETAGPRWYDRSLYEPNLSPAIQQWPAAAEVMALWRDPVVRATLEDLARQHMARLRAAPDAEAAGAEALWLTEFFRLNVPDFWWVHLELLGVPAAWTRGVLACLVLGGAASLWKCFRVCRAEGAGT